VACDLVQSTTRPARKPRFVTNGDPDYHGYVPSVRLIEHTRRAQRLVPGWEADVVPVTVSLVNREGARAIGMDIRAPGQFLHDALPRAHRYLDRFNHDVGRLAKE